MFIYNKTFLWTQSNDQFIHRKRNALKTNKSFCYTFTVRNKRLSEKNICVPRAQQCTWNLRDTTIVHLSQITFLRGTKDVRSTVQSYKEVAHS